MQSTTHHYPTRFQVKLQKELARRAAEEAALLQSINYVKGILNEMKGADVCKKTEQTILLFEHLYEVPLLLESHTSFRYTIWNKMNELEETLLATLHRTPAKSAQYGAEATTEYEMRTRLLSFNLLHLMESVRVMFW
jgi:hypothetical protein